MAMTVRRLLPVRQGFPAVSPVPWRWQPQRPFFFGKKEEKPVDKPMEETNDPTSALVLPQAGDNAPKLATLLALPVRRPVFPGLMSAAILRDERVIDAIIKSNESGIGYLGTFLRRADSSDNAEPEKVISEIITRADQIHKVGTFAQIQGMFRLENGGLQLLLMGHRRINLEEVLQYGPPLSVRVNHWKKPILVESTTLKAYRNELIMAVRELFKLNPLAQEHSGTRPYPNNSSSQYILMNIVITHLSNSPHQHTLATHHITTPSHPLS